MKPLIQTLSIFCLGLAVTNCSYRYREVNTGRDSAFVNQELSAIMQGLSSSQSNSLNSSGVSASQYLADLSSDPSTLIYYTEGGTDPQTNKLSALGAADTVMANDFTELSNGQVELGQLKYFRALFLVRHGPSGEEGMLVMRYLSVTGQADFVALSSMGLDQSDSGFSNGIYTIRLNGFSEEITFEIDDLKEDSNELRSDIQIKLSSPSRNLGKITALQGY